jgi:hypothetical protein
MPYQISISGTRQRLMSRLILSHALLLDSGYVDAFFKSGKLTLAIALIAFPSVCFTNCA